MGIPEFKWTLEDTVLNVFIILMAEMRSHAYVCVCEKSLLCTFQEVVYLM